jgi:hypothetical protein
MSRGASGLVRPRLLVLAGRARILDTSGAVAAAVSILAGSGLALVALDAVLPLPAGLRLAALVGLAVLVGLRTRRLGRALRALPPEALAQRAERLAGVTDNALINACQFEAMTLSPAEAAWLPPTSAAAAHALARTPLARLLRLRELGLALAGLALVGLTMAAGILVWPDHLVHGARRLALPLADLPPLGAAVITVEPTGIHQLDDGADLRLRVTLRPADGRKLALPVPTLAFEDDREAPALRQAAAGWTLVLADQHRSSAFRVVCAGTVTPLVRIEILPAPALTRSRFLVDGPTYAGIKHSVRPGPPAALAVLPGATVRLELAVDRELPALRWNVPGGGVDLVRKGDAWQGLAPLNAAGAYTVSAGSRVLARGEIRLETDLPPEVALGGAERNRFVDPGSTLDLPVLARDDHGLGSVTVEVREALDGSAPVPVRAWQLIGPPGPQELAETLHLQLDSARFQPGRAYLCEAIATDRQPQSARSPALVLRVRAVKDLALPPGDRRAAAFEALRRCLAEQVRARAAAGNLLANLAEIRAHKGLAAQATAASGAQEAARLACVAAVTAFAAANEGSVLPVLKPIADPAMPHLVKVLAGLDVVDAATRLPPLCREQDDLIVRLTALLGTIAADAREEQARKAEPAAANHEADRHKAEELAQDLKRFLDEQQRILDRSRTLADGGGADLTADEERIAGELAKAEREWAKFLEEKLTNFAQNPPQDFSDASLATETNAVWQDVKLAADALDGKKIELAVPREQSGIENAEKLVNNLEKWLSDAPDKLKWEMEDAQAPADVAVAELPAELEDIVGELLDKAEEMTPDVQDATSAWMDSLDKGAGWTAADGPISNMSAKGITGNVLPNQSEIGGRSGEGRNGRSNGQMVQDAAVGKGGQETPTRLSQTPFEKGSVKDSSTESGGGATGGGKSSGFDSEGLRGPTPPPQLQQAMARLAGKQQELRQQAETLTTGLRARRLPSAGVESAVVALEAAAAAASRFEGDQLKQAHTRLLDNLAAARRDVAAASTVQRERSRLGDRARGAAAAGADEAVPAGYEQMAGAYFRALAGEKP